MNTGQRNSFRLNKRHFCFEFTDQIVSLDVSFRHAFGCSLISIRRVSDVGWTNVSLVNSFCRAQKIRWLITSTALIVHCEQATNQSSLLVLWNENWTSITQMTIVSGFLPTFYFTNILDCYRDISLDVRVCSSELCFERRVAVTNERKKIQMNWERNERILDFYFEDFFSFPVTCPLRRATRTTAKHKLGGWIWEETAKKRINVDCSELTSLSSYFSLELSSNSSYESEEKRLTDYWNILHKIPDIFSVPLILLSKQNRFTSIFL